MDDPGFISIVLLLIHFTQSPWINNLMLGGKANGSQNGWDNAICVSDSFGDESLSLQSEINAWRCA